MEGRGEKRSSSLDAYLNMYFAVPLGKRHSSPSRNHRGHLVEEGDCNRSLAKS